MVGQALSSLTTSRLYIGLVSRPCRRLPDIRELATRSLGVAQGPQFLYIKGEGCGWKGEDVL